MFIHIANRLHKTKPFRQSLFIFIEARLRHLPPFEGSPRAGAAEYVLRGGMFKSLPKYVMQKNLSKKFPQPFGQIFFTKFKIQNSEFKIPKRTMV